jgi:hypothetical protein
MTLEQTTEIDDGRFVGDLVAAKLEPGERAHRLDVVERLLGTGIGQQISILKKADPQHHFNRVGPPPASGLRIVRFDQRDQKPPRHNHVHFSQEPFAFRVLLLVLEIEHCEAQLLHRYPINSILRECHDFRLIKSSLRALRLWP